MKLPAGATQKAVLPFFPLVRNTCILLLLLCNFKVGATHLMGGTFTYKYVGNDKYGLEWVIYRDCNPGTAAFPSAFTYYYRGATSTSSSNKSVKMFGTAKKIVTTLTKCASSYCIEKGVYRDTITLGSDTVGYHFWYNNTARNNSITNIYNSGNTGMTWYGFIPAKNYKNSSPNLTKDPVPVICASKTNIFNAGFYDPDGDSLVFSLVTPYDGSGTPNSGFGTVSYASGYSVTKPFGSTSDAIVIDPVTGEIKAKPNNTGKYVLAIEVQEYRVNPVTKKAEYLSKVRVDLQFIAVNCGTNPEPVFDKDTSNYTRTVDIGQQVCFSVTGRDTQVYNGKKDTLKLTAYGPVLGKDKSFSPPYGYFKDTIGYTYVTSQFCWTPECKHVTFTSPHLVTFRLEDQGCNTVEQTYKIYVRPRAFVKPPALQCVSVAGSSYITLEWDTAKADTNFQYYRIYRRKNKSGEYFKEIRQIKDRLRTTWTDSTANNANDTIYQYYITSVNGCNIDGGSTDTVQSIVVRKKQISTGSTLYTWNSSLSKLQDSFMVYADTGSGYVLFDIVNRRSYEFKFCAPDVKLKVMQRKKNINCMSESGESPKAKLQDKTAPDAPNIYSVSITDWSHAKLSFYSSASTDAAWYRIYRSRNGGSFILRDSVKHKDATVLSYTDTGRFEQDKYAYKIVTVDYCGNQSVTAVHKPVLLQAAAGNLKVDLSWNKYVGFITGGNDVEKWIDGSWKKFKSLSNSDTTFTDTLVTCGSFYYRIKANETGGNSKYAYSDSVVVKVLDTVFPTPTKFEYATVNSDNTVELAFNTIKDNDGIRYIIYRETGSSGMQSLDTFRIAHPNKYIYEDKTAKASNRNYCYKLAIIDSCGNTTYSIKTCPVNLTATPGNHSTQLNWSAYQGQTVTKYYIERLNGSSTWQTLDSVTSDTAYVDSALLCYKRYHYRIRAALGNSETVYSDTGQVLIFDTVPPDVPVVEYASVISDNSVKIAFRSSVDKDLKQYLIYGRKNSGAYALLKVQPNTSASEYFYTQSGINTLKDTFSYYVIAVDTCAGNKSKPLNVHRAMQLHSQALNLKNRLNWSGYIGFKKTTYYVQRLMGSSWKPLQQINDTFNTFTDTSGIDCNHRYYYRLMAVSPSQDTAYSDTTGVMAFDTIRPATVNFVSASVMNGSSIKLIFEKVADKDVNRYVLWSSKNGGSFSPLDTVWRPSNPLVTYTHTGINALKDTFSYRVYALDSCAERTSAVSEEHRTIQLNGAAGDYANQLSWSAYKGFKVRQYFVQQYTGSGWAILDSTNSSKQSYLHSPISCDTRYYRIKAIEDDPSATVVYSDSIALTTFDTVHPAAPGIDYVDVAKGNKTVYLQWTKSASNDVNRYIIQRRTDGGKWKAIDTLQNVSSFIDTTAATADSAYCYAVQALDSCASLTSPFSGEHCIIHLEADSELCNQQLFLVWTAYKGWPVGKYNIYKTEQGGSEKLLRSVPDTQLTFVDSFVDYKKSYTYRVEAVPASSSIKSFSSSSSAKTYEPLVPEILFVSKLSTDSFKGKTLIKWKSVAGDRFYKYYQLYAKSSTGSWSLLADKLPVRQDTFIHLTNTVTDHYSYYIEVVDSCGNHTNPSATHTDMDLTVNIGQLKHVLKWTPYSGWPVKQYEIQRLEKGVFTTLDTVPSDTNLVIFPAPCNYNIFYRIQAVHADGRYSWSDTVGRQAIDTIPPNSATLRNVSVVDGSKMDIRFIGADSLDLFKYVIERSTNGSWATAGDVIFTVPEDNHEFTDKTSTLTNRLCYTLVTLDSCLNYAASDTFCAMQLDGTPLDEAVSLRWKPFTGYGLKEQELQGYDGQNWQKLMMLPSADTTIMLDTLHCNIPYYYRVKGYGNDGTRITYSDSISLIPFDTINPEPARIQYVSSNDQGQVHLAWDYDHKSDLKFFEIWRSTGGGAYKKAGMVIYDTVFTENVDVNKSQSYYVIGIDSCDMSHRSIPSDTDRVMNLKLKTGACVPLVRLSWTPYAGANIGSYEVWRMADGESGYSRLASLQPSELSYVDSAVTEGTYYSYRIKGLFKGSSLWSTSDSARMQPWVFPAPDSAHMVYATVQKSGTADGEIYLEWKKYDGKADTFARGYRIYHSTDGINYTLAFQETDFSKNTFIHKNVNTASGANYYYLEVYNLCNVEGEKSIIQRPLNLSVTNRNLQVDLVWSPYKGDEVQEYRIYRWMNAGAAVQYATLAAADTFFSDTNILCRQHYRYQVFAYLKNGKITVSDTESVNSFDTIPPAQPMILAVNIDTTLAAGKISLQFRGNREPNRSGYRIYRSSDGLTYVPAGLLMKINQDTFYWEEQPVNTIRGPWYYAVSALDSCGNESMPGDTHATVHLDALAFSQFVRLQWTAYKGWKEVAQYKVERREPGKGWKFLALLDSSMLGYHDSSAICHIYYEYRITALDRNSPLVTYSNTSGDTAFELVAPAEPLIRHVTVTQTSPNKGKIYFSWNHSVSRDYSKYHLYRSENGGMNWKPLVTLTDTMFLDSGLNTFNKAYTYTIWTEDSCGNLSLDSSRPHTSILLKAASLNEAIGLKWTAYQGWKVKRYDIFRDGGKIASVGGDTLDYTDTLINCTLRYNYYVMAVSDSTDALTSLSNTDSNQAFDTRPPRQPHLIEASVNNPNRGIYLLWNRAHSRDVKGYNIWRKDGKTGYYAQIGSTADTSYSLTADAGLSSSSCYIIEAFDYCENRSSWSNEGCIIILTGKTAGAEHQLHWNAYTKWNKGVANYNVYRNLDSTGWQKLATVTDVTYTDNVFFTSDTLQSYCYRVEGVEGAGGEGRSFSTVYCLSQEPIVYMPNAFTPGISENINDVFGPKGAYIKSYDMKIYNRWGQTVYETSSAKPWDGRMAGSYVQEGVYMYHITIHSYTGKDQELEGTVMVLR